MKPAVDAETLIACSPCAKAKARCDKRANNLLQLPTCSRCLFKRQKCQPRQPRRYPEAFLLLGSDLNSPIATHFVSSAPTPPASNVPASRVPASTIGGDQNAFTPQTPMEAICWPEGSTSPKGPGTVAFSDDAIGAFAAQYDLLLSPSSIFPEPRDPSLDYNPLSHSYDVMTQDSHDHPSNSTMSAEVGSLIPAGAAQPLPPLAAQYNEKAANNSDEDWPCFGCNPRTQRWIDPRIGGEHLMRLEKTLDELPGWRTNFYPDATDPEVKVEKLEEGLRDRVMVIAQGFFSRAREVRQAGLWEATLWRKSSISQNNVTGFFILPPTSVLEGFLRMYSSRVEPYMPFFSGKLISPTELLRANDEKISVLLLLCMIAHGAMGSSLQEARDFASGLIEICRICIWDVLEKNVQLAAHPVMLRCALLYLQASAWSGNRWHMDLCAAQLRSYTSMLKYARILDARRSTLESIYVITDAEAAWTIWCEEERLNRLTYAWVVLDQEVNLFYDHPLDLDVNELNSYLPRSEELWTATSAEMWLATYLELRKTNEAQTGSQQHGTSLAMLFRRFTNGELSHAGSDISQLELRLLLHPIQALIYHLYKSFSHCFSSNSQRHLQRFLAQVEEVQYLLKQWYDLTQQSFRHDDTFTSQGCCNMVLYHLISLNALTSIPDIERFARGEISIADFRESIWMAKRYVEDACSIWCHGGQILRLVQKLPLASRPYWWYASIYRAALSMWAAGVATQQAQHDTSIRTGTEYVAVDTLPFHHPTIVRLMRHRDGVPSVSRAETATAIIHEPGDILKHCVVMLEDYQSISQLAKSIKDRLVVLLGRVGPESS